MFHSKLRVSLMFVGVVMMPGPGAGWLEERRSGLLTRTGTGGGPARADLFWTFTNSNSEDSLDSFLTWCATDVEEGGGDREHGEKYLLVTQK